MSSMHCCLSSQTNLLRYFFKQCLLRISHNMFVIVNMATAAYCSLQPYYNHREGGGKELDDNHQLCHSSCKVKASKLSLTPDDYTTKFILLLEIRELFTTSFSQDIFQDVHTSPPLRIFQIVSHPSYQADLTLLSILKVSQSLLNVTTCCSQIVAFDYL